MIRPSREDKPVISGSLSTARAELLVAIEKACVEAVAARDSGAWRLSPVIHSMNNLIAAAVLDAMKQEVEDKPRGRHGWLKLPD